MINKTAYQKLIQAAALQYKSHPSAMAQTVSKLLSELKMIERIRSKNSTSTGTKSFSIDSHILLNDIIVKDTHPILSSLIECFDSLNWRPSGFGRLPPEITNHVAVVEIIGPDGMIEDQRFRFGLLLQDPHITYAKHQHAAEELYFVLNGVASWAVDNNEVSNRNVNEFIHHAENQPHQMITNEEPLLAMWAWLGDIDSKSYSI